MIARRQASHWLVLLCSGVLLTSACAASARSSTGRRGTFGESADRAASTQGGAVAQVGPEAIASPPDSGPTVTCRPDGTRVICQDGVAVAGSSVPPLLRPLSSASLTGEELSVLGPDSSAWIAFALMVAGVGPGAQRLYVDGMPVTSAPASMIDRVTVNGDPFTAEHSNVGATRIDIEPRTPDRRWRGDLSSPSFGAGGGSPLGPTGAPMSRSTTFGLSGAVPRLPLTFSVQGSRRLDARRPLFAMPHAGTLATADDDLLTTSNGSGLAMGVVLLTNRVVVRATWSGNSMHAEHAGIGGTNGPTTGQRLDSKSHSLQTTWRIADTERVHRGGFSFRKDSLNALADSPAPSIMVTGQLATGGDELAVSTRRSAAWTFKHVVDGGSGKWKTGFEGTRDVVSNARTPNPHGRFQLATADAVTGTWIVSAGPSAASAETTSAALFAEQLTMHTPRATLRSGIRLDWQDGAGIIVSPRVVASVRVARFQVSAAAGLFVQAWAPDLFATAAGRTGSTGMFVLQDVPALSIDAIEPARGDRLRIMIMPAFERRRDLIARAGLLRNIGPLHTGIEHTWTHGTSLTGAVRERGDGELVDVISSGRRLRRHQTHVRASMHRKVGSITAHYQHAWSFDDSDAPLALPARAGDVQGEWARSTGVPRHAAGLTASVRLPHQIRVSLMTEAQSGLPYTILSGRDVGGLAAFSDRGGLPRNAGTLPAFRKLSLAASRLVRIPSVAWLAFDVGIRADNLTNQRNVTSVGHVLGSPMFGVPLSASPGRSVRFWAALAR